MRKYILFNIILFIFISCQKNKLNRSTTSSQDNTIAVIAFNDLLKVTEDVIINEELEKSSNSILNNCATVTIHPSLPDTSFPKTITIDSLPEANFTYSSACVGDSITFSSNSSVNSDMVVNYEWNFLGIALHAFHTRLARAQMNRTSEEFRPIG